MYGCSPRIGMYIHTYVYMYNLRLLSKYLPARMSCVRNCALLDARVGYDTIRYNTIRYDIGVE